MQDGSFPQGGAKIKKGPGGNLLSRDERSTIGAGGLDFRVRDGNGYGTSAVATGPAFRLGAHPRSGGWASG